MIGQFERKGWLCTGFIFHRRGHRVTEVNMNKQPEIWKKGLVVYWHYFSRPRASCRRGEQPASWVSSLTHLRVGQRSGRRREMTYVHAMTHLHQSWYGLHCHSKGRILVASSISQCGEREKGVHASLFRIYFESRGFELASRWCVTWQSAVPVWENSLRMRGFIQADFSSLDNEFLVRWWTEEDSTRVLTFPRGIIWPRWT